MRENVIHRIMERKIIAIIRGMDEKSILFLAEALYKGGISLIEVTFNQKAPESFAVAGRVISAITRSFGGDVSAGAGTVMTEEQLVIARDSGAEYIVSPHTNADIIRKTRENGLVSIPGAMTPSECAAAWEAGADFVKLFPAGDLGPGYLTAIRAPLSHIRFLCVGGITFQNIPGFMSAGSTGFGIGGNMVNKEWVESRQSGKITALTREYVNAARTGGG